MNDTQTINIVTAGQQAIISGVRNENTLFTFGSIEAYVSAQNADRKKWNPSAKVMSVEAELERARRNGHEIAWAIPEGCCIVDSATYPSYYSDRQAKVSAALKLFAGDIVQIEGRNYRLTPASYNNVSLIPVAA